MEASLDTNVIIHLYKAKLQSVLLNRFQASLAYYQFETIHPFESGNGRLGRLFPAKILLENGVLSRPLLTLSNYLFENNDECLRIFMGVQHFGAYLDWIKFLFKE